MLKEPISLDVLPAPPVAQKGELGWQRMCELDPGLADLVREARQCQTKDPLGTFLRDFKPWVQAKAGWRRRDDCPELASAECYDELYERVLTALRTRP
jgi:hypothetical protein